MNLNYIAVLVCVALAGCFPGGSSEGTGMGTGGGEPPPDAATVLATFKSCMTKTNWDAAQMQAVAENEAKWGTRCADCHDGGAGGLFAHYDSDIMFNRTRDEFLSGLFRVEGAIMVPVDLEPSGQRPGHRTYFPEPDTLAALTQFAEATNNCD